MGENTQYNGKDFHKQKFRARAMTEQGFADWLKAVRETGVALTPNVYDHIRAKGTADDVRKAIGAGGGMPLDTVYLKDVPAHLFGNVIESYHGGVQTSRALLSGVSARRHSRSNLSLSARNQSSRTE